MNVCTAAQASISLSTLVQQMRKPRTAQLYIQYTHAENFATNALQPSTYRIHVAGNIGGNYVWWIA